MNIRFVKICTKKLLIGFFTVLIIFAPVSHTLVTPQKTDAFFGGLTFDPKNFIQNSFTAAKSYILTSLSNSLVVKEFSLDAIAWAAINILLEEMIRDTTYWVNSGFEGKPFFVQDLKGFLSQTADDYALYFINQDIVKYLCSPFQASVSAALALQYTQFRQHQPYCTFSDAVRNINSFKNGDFITGGGWNAWFNVSLNPNLYQQGAFARASAALDAGAQTNVLNVKADVSFGSGFLGKKECEPPAYDDYGNEVDVKPKCVTVTPGETINQSLNKALGATSDRLTVADEFNELIAALVNQLVVSALGGEGGLASVSPRSSSPRNPFEGFSQPILQEHNQVIDLNTLETGAQDELRTSEQEFFDDEIFGPTFDYLSLLGETVRIIESCDGTMDTATRISLDTQLEDTKDEMALVLSGSKTVTSSTVQIYSSSTFSDLITQVTNLPLEAGCTLP